MERTRFTASTPSGELSGWVTGEGPRVLGADPRTRLSELEAPGCLLAAMDRLNADA